MKQIILRRDFKSLLSDIYKLLDFTSPDVGLEEGEIKCGIHDIIEGYLNYKLSLNKDIPVFEFVHFLESEITNKQTNDTVEEAKNKIKCFIFDNFTNTKTLNILLCDDIKIYKSYNKINDKCFDENSCVVSSRLPNSSNNTHNVIIKYNDLLTYYNFMLEISKKKLCQPSKLDSFQDICIYNFSPYGWELCNNDNNMSIDNPMHNRMKDVMSEFRKLMML